MTIRIMGRAAARHRWDRLKVSFWFAPTLMALAAVLLAWAMYWLDSQIPNAALADSRFILSGTVAELRSTLLNIAGTVLATAGVVFTLLTLPLSTVAAQYGSRLLRVFLGDRTTQFVLGMFVGTFVYCLAGALSIPSTAVEPAGPQLTATVGLYLMLATFATLILLVQHISTMLQAPNIAAAAGAELREVVHAEITDQVTSGADQSRTGQGALDALVGDGGLSGSCHRHRLPAIHRSGDHAYPGPGKGPGHPPAAQAGALRLAWHGGRPDLAREPGRRAVGGTNSPARSRSATCARPPRMSNTRSTSSPKWPCEPCRRRSMTRSRP